MTVEEKLRSMGLTLPEPPAPAGAYLRARRTGNLIFVSGQLPLEDDYQEIRRQIWLAADGAYKEALENLSKKRAALQNRTRTEELADFSREEPFTVADDTAPVEVDAARWPEASRATAPTVPIGLSSFPVPGSNSRSTKWRSPACTRR